MSKKSFIDTIRVESPCHEDWDEMIGNDRIRFCSHCSKNVNNLTDLTRRQAEKLVRKYAGRLCVRYHADPKSRSPIFSSRASSLARHSLAAGALGASLLTAGVFSQTENPTQQLVQIERVQPAGSSTSKISGYVVDPNGAAIPYALVTVTNLDTLLAHVQNATGEGFFEFKDLDAGKYKIRYEAGGFDPVESGDLFVSEAAELRRDGHLRLAGVAEVVEVGADGDVQQVILGGAIVVVSLVDVNPLVQAVFNEDLPEVKIRIGMRARINGRDKSRDGMSALHAAVETNNLEIAEYLLTHGAKANIRDFEKRTPLMMLDEDSSPEMFQLLIRFGAKPLLVDKQKNNLLHHLALNDADSELMRAAVLYGLNLDQLNKEGKTPLMIAAESFSLDAVKALIEAGANVNFRNRAGRTALDEAADDPAVRSLLETHGAVAGSR